ncbi:MAG: hypothetical protein ACM3QZ_02870 [Solirubrobacterales bacterium]
MGNNMFLAIWLALVWQQTGRAESGTGPGLPPSEALRVEARHSPGLLPLNLLAGLMHHPVRIYTDGAALFDGLLIDLHPGYLTLFQSDSPFPVAYIPLVHVTAVAQSVHESKPHDCVTTGNAPE